MEIRILLLIRFAVISGEIFQLETKDKGNKKLVIFNISVYGFYDGEGILTEKKQFKGFNVV